ncbi:MAG: GNAT family N-acetyltransferase [Lysobacter sp.]
MSHSTARICLRRATAEDVVELSHLSTRTFVETSGHLYCDSDLQTFLAATYSIEAQRAVLADPACAVWLLEHDGVAVGHAAAGPCRLPHPDASADDGEIKDLFVLREMQNGGWGGRLFETALRWLERDGPRTLWIGVWSENYGGLRFYQRYGFEKAGEYQFVVGNARDREFILRRGLQERSDQAGASTPA